MLVIWNFFIGRFNLRTSQLVRIEFGTDFGNLQLKIKNINACLFPSSENFSYINIQSFHP